MWLSLYRGQWNLSATGYSLDTFITSHKRSLQRLCFHRCLSVHMGFLGLCPGGISILGDLCLRVSVWGSLSGRSLSKGVSVWGSLSGGVSVQGNRGCLYLGGLCLGGLCPGGLCLGGLCPGGLCPGGLCLGVSVQTETP